MSEILTNSSFITEVDKLITKWGGTPSNLSLTPDEANDMVNVDIFKTKMNELVTVAPTGGSGASVFIVDINEEGTTQTLDKTWKEIHDAMVGGQTVLVRYSYSNDGYIDDRLYLVDQMEASGSDSISYNVNTGTTVYGTNSEDGYPQTSFD